MASIKDLGKRRREGAERRREGADKYASYGKEKGR